MFSFFEKRDWVIIAPCAQTWQPTTAGASVNMAAASVTPQIVKFGFKDYVVDDANKKRTAVCRVCSIKISDTTTTTSNFIRHYKNTHRERCVNVLCYHQPR